MIYPRPRPTETEKFLVEICRFMDEAPEWRDWFDRQLELLDLRYDQYYALGLPTLWIR